MQPRGTILVFLKYPAPGRVKTRLAATVGPDQAAALYRRWIRTVLDLLQPLRANTTIIGYHDGAPRESFREWHHLADDWWPQPAGDLGERLEAGFQLALVSGGPVLAIGTDCLELDADLLYQALALLPANDVVFGPTPDGGYFLVGMSALLPGLFRSIRWSGPHTLSDHLESCRSEGWSVTLLPTRHDIDTWDDWNAYLKRTSASEGEPREPGCHHPDS